MASALSTSRQLQRNKQGWLKPYSLACGYIEQFIHEDHRLFDGVLKLTLERDSACYHVKLFTYSSYGSGPVRLVWDSFELNSLRRVRRRYARLKKQILTGEIKRLYSSKISYA